MKNERLMDMEEHDPSDGATYDKARLKAIPRPKVRNVKELTPFERENAQMQKCLSRRMELPCLPPFNYEGGTEGG